MLEYFAVQILTKNNGFSYFIEPNSKTTIRRNFEFFVITYNIIIYMHYYDNVHERQTVYRCEGINSLKLI